MLTTTLLPLLLLGTAEVTATPACVPMPGDPRQAAPSAEADHRTLRAAMNEPMPNASSMVMLFGAGGHLATYWYSIILTRRQDGRWHGTAVGRSRIWVDGAPYTPMERREWDLSSAASKLLDAAIDRPCPAVAPSPAKHPDEPPPLGEIVRRIDVITKDRPNRSFFVDEDHDELTSLIVPPK